MTSRRGDSSGSPPPSMPQIGTGRPTLHRRGGRAARAHAAAAPGDYFRGQTGAKMGDWEAESTQSHTLTHSRTHHSLISCVHALAHSLAYSPTHSFTRTLVWLRAYSFVHRTQLTDHHCHSLAHSVPPTRSRTRTSILSPTHSLTITSVIEKIAFKDVVHLTSIARRRRARRKFFECCSQSFFFGHGTHFRLVCLLLRSAKM